MTVTRRLRIEEQIQTAETDTTKRLAPDGAGGVEWSTGGGGGGSCDHQHTHDRFVAAGDTPETFTLAAEPMWPDGVQVTVNGSSADPDDVTITGSDVSLNTAADDVVVIWYAKACASGPPSGDLAFPGEDGGIPDWGNTLATIVATGPGYVKIVLTDTGVAYDGLLTDVVDAAGTTSTGWFGSDGFSGSFNATPGTFYLPIPTAGTWYIVTNEGNPYDAGINDGVGTYEVVYPSTPTGSLNFPGSSNADVQNELQSIVTAGDTIFFLTIDSPMPTGWFLGIGNSPLTDDHYVSPDVPAGTYVFFTAGADTRLPYGYSTGTYDGGLTNTGTYEEVTL